MPQAVGIISLIGAGVSAAQQANQGQIAGAQAKNQATLMEYEAQDRERAGVADQNRYRRELSRVLGKQRAIVGANGIQDLGSPLAVQEDTAAAGIEDIANIQHQASLDAYGIRIGAKDTRYQGQAARRAGNVGAFNSLVQGFGAGGGSKLAQGFKAGANRLRGNRQQQYLDSPILTGSTYYGGYNA